MADRATPLLERHRALGARIVDFAGWEMPLHYEGTVSEHNAVRTASGLFDVTHLGKLGVAGTGATRALQHAVTSDVDALAPGAATYGLVLTDEGGCVDDIFVYRLAPDSFMVVPNAANHAAVARMIELSGGDVEDWWDHYAILALQGPESFDVFERALPDATDTPARDLKLHTFSAADLLGAAGLVARTGYTGERGYEIYVPFTAAERVWDTLLQAGARPAGLGARDTLRLEMGYALYGHELDLETSPVEARLGWAVAWDTDFRGRAAAERVKEEGPRRRLVGIRLRDKGVPRQGYEVTAPEGEAIGTVTSGNHSPTLGTGIALAYVDADWLRRDEGSEVRVAARGRALAGDIVKPPFISR